MIQSWMLFLLSQVFVAAGYLLLIGDSPLFGLATMLSAWTLSAYAGWVRFR